MAIRPVDIRRKEFQSGFRGYDANQVDDFLDSVADEFERVFAENQRLADEMTSLRERLEQFEELEASIQEALVHAQQVARDLRRNANKEAELIVREAKEQSHRILADSSSRVERVQESYEVLRKAKQDFANDFRYLLKSYTELMDNVDVASAKEIEASLRERLDLESVATARQAAETQRTERDQSPPGEPTAEPEAAQRMGTTATSGESTDPTTDAPGGARPLGPEEPEVVGEPEIEEPEVTPSTAEQPPPEVPETGPNRSHIEEEVEREEPMPTGEGQEAADRFFDRGETREARAEESQEEGRIFRASRFLRRRD
jgi:cell division initiation protein